MSGETLGSGRVEVNFRDSGVDSLTYLGFTHKVININWELNTNPDRDGSHYIYTVETPWGPRVVEMKYDNPDDPAKGGELIMVWNPETEIDQINALAEWSGVWITSPRKPIPEM